MALRYTVIRPDNRSGEGPLKAARHLLAEIWRFRSHIKIVFKQQFQAAYSGTGLGVVWNYALPIIPLSVYLLLTSIRVFPRFEGVNGATFLTFGAALWFFFAGCVQTPIQTIVARNKEVMKTAFPLSAAIVSEFARLLFDSLVRLGFVVLIVVAFQDWPGWTAVMLPLVLLPALLLFLGSGLLLGILNVIYKDVGRVVTILLQYGIFLSGVLFPLPQAGRLASINRFNPFAVFIESGRSVVFRGGVDNIAAYGVMSLLALAIFLLACRVFYVMEHRIRGIS